MQLRKYTKIFKNRASAMKFLHRMEDVWERLGLSNEYYPRSDLSFVFGDRKHITRYTVTYYLQKYGKEQKISENDFYGSSKADAIIKFKKTIVDNFPIYRLIIKNVKLKADHGPHLKLYTFRYYLKPRK